MIALHVAAAITPNMIVNSTYINAAPIFFAVSIV